MSDAIDDATLATLRSVDTPTVCNALETGFGILQSMFHEVWCTYFGNRIGAGNQRRYNASFAYLTFPFPMGLTPNVPATDYADDPRAKAITAALYRYVGPHGELREHGRLVLAAKNVPSGSKA